MTTSTPAPNRRHETSIHPALSLRVAAAATTNTPPRLVLPNGAAILCDLRARLCEFDFSVRISSGSSPGSATGDSTFSFPPSGKAVRCTGLSGCCPQTKVTPIAAMAQGNTNRSGGNTPIERNINTPAATNAAEPRDWASERVRSGRTPFAVGAGIRAGSVHHGQSAATAVRRGAFRWARGATRGPDRCPGDPPTPQSAYSHRGPANCRTAPPG